MAVPNTDDFSLQDVCDEMNNNGESDINTLSECFGASNDSGFNTTYKGSKDRLSNFRDYNHAPALSYIPIDLSQTPSTYQGACNDYNNGFVSIFYIPTGEFFNETTVLKRNPSGTLNAFAGYYSDGVSSRYWNGSSFTQDWLCPFNL